MNALPEIRSTCSDQERRVNQAMFGKTKSRGLRGVAAAIAAGAMLLTGFMGATTANAADAPANGTITINDAGNKDKFVGYEPFTIVSKAADGAYGYKINTGKGFTVENLTAVINAIPDSADTKPTLGTPVTENKILEWMTAYFPADQATSLKDGAKAQAFAKAVVDMATATSSGVTPTITESTAADINAGTYGAGYYVIAQTEGSEPNDPTAGKTATFTRYIAGNVEADSPLIVDMKNSTVEAEKKIKDNTASLDSIDYNIGDKVEFEFTGKLPATYDDYTTFKYIFHDDMAESLTFNQDSVKVYVVTPNGDSSTQTELKSGFTTNTSPTDGHTFDIDFGNLKDVTYGTGTKLTKDDTILIQYSATLNEKATIGGAGNTNKMELEFSNNPYDDTKTGKTPEDKVVVFTYQLNVNKVDSATPTTKLEGAKFKLWQDEDKTKGAQVVNDVLTKWADNDATELTTDANGLISIKGLDSGTYYLEETEAPAGYNKLDELVPIILTATTTVDGIKANPTITFDGTPGNGDAKTGIFAGNVENNKGTVLPSTGGMGTTILYTVGAIIVAVAGFGLAMVLRRRRV